MDIRKNIAVVSAAWCLSCCAFELEATSLTDLQNRLLSLPHVSGELGEQIEAIRQELARLIVVEERSPWGRFNEEMLRIYPFFDELPLRPIKLYFPGEGFSATQSQWWTAYYGAFLTLLREAQETLDAEAQDEDDPDAEVLPSEAQETLDAETQDEDDPDVEVLPPEQREAVQPVLQDAVDVVQALLTENQRTLAEEQESIERRRAQINPEEYMASVPEDLRDVATYLQNLERGIWDPDADVTEILDLDVDVGEMFEKQIRLMKWQVEQSLAPYLPNEADRDQFFRTSKRVQDEVVEGLGLGDSMPEEEDYS
jgi:hypothetical protein